MNTIAVDDATPIVTVHNAAAGPLVYVRAVALAVAPYTLLNGAVGRNAAPPPVLLSVPKPTSVLAATRPYGSAEAVRIAKLTLERPGVVAVVVRPAHR